MLSKPKQTLMAVLPDNTW